VLEKRDKLCICFVSILTLITMRSSLYIATWLARVWRVDWWLAPIGVFAEFMLLVGACLLRRLVFGAYGVSIVLLAQKHVKCL